MSEIPKISRRNIIAGLAAAPLLASKSIASMGVPQIVESAFSTDSSNEVPRYQHAAVSLLTGIVIVSGGYQVSLERRAANTPASDSVQIMNPFNGNWIDAAPMNHPRARHAAVALYQGKIAVLGGYSLAPIDSIEVYDPKYDRWDIIGQLPRPMADLQACLSGSNIIVTGGGNASFKISLQSLNIAF